MIQIYLKNIQTIDEFLFKFPEKGVVQFTGNNSNGKSILGKAVSRVVLQMLVHDDKRLPLIQDGKDSALVNMAYNKRGLIVNIDKDANKTYYGLIRENGEKVIRHLREGGITEILREFGFVVYGKNLVCLQICETFGLMPFINTPDTINGEIVNSVTTDIPSEQFLENYKITFKEAKALMNNYKREITSCETALSMREPKDVSGLKELIERSKVVQEKATYLKRAEHIILEPFPKLEFHYKKAEKLDMLPLITRYTKSPKLFNLDKYFVDMRKIREGRCPTCGKPMLSNCSHDKVQSGGAQ